jgi:RNA polymerase sigma-70 factor (ECF subfamily)
MNFDDRNISLENLNRYRNYLRFLAKVQLGADLRAKVDPSDIVQQSLLLAHQAWGDFRGTSEAELAAWLRAILSRTIAHATRDWKAQKRDVERERTIEAAVDASSARLGQFLVAEQSSPSQAAMRREQEVLVAEAVESLSADQCEAIVLRYWQGMTLNGVAEAMNKSPAATAGLLHRGLKALRSRLQNLDAT